MTIPRIILYTILEDGNLVEISSEHYHYLVRVHRLKSGDKFYLLDKNRREFLCEVVDISKNKLTAYCFLFKNLSEPNYKIKLIFSLLKGDKNEFLIKAGTQMGITDFEPIITSRTIIRLDPVKAKEKVERFRKVAEDTARTSFLSFIPAVAEIKDIKQLSLEVNSLHLFLSEKKDIPLISSYENEIRQSNNITVLLGPEGGIDEEEFKFLIEKGYKPISLGERALKAEFAFVFGLSVVIYINRGRF